MVYTINGRRNRPRTGFKGRRNKPDGSNSKTICIMHSTKAENVKAKEQMEWKHLVVERTKINENKKGQRQNN
jgi:hypothetical protein